MLASTPIMATVVSPLLEDLATPVSLGVYLRIKYGEWEQLVRKTIAPVQYCDSDAYAKDAIAVSLLRKCVDIPTDIDREAVAVENFHLSEEQCTRSNVRLTRYLDSLTDPSYEGFDGFDTRIMEFIQGVRKRIKRVLGRAPHGLLKGKFGSGSTFSDPSRASLVPDKMSSRPALTNSLLPIYLFDWGSTAWASACRVRGIEPEFVPGNRFETVDKDATKDRGIAIEPSLNLFYQLALGGKIKECLRRYGLPLEQGKDIHMTLAREGSASYRLSTLDLTNASDTVCRVLVKLLLPNDWYQLLSWCRSPKTRVNGKWFELQKFSSMGNGYTFELETLIFLAISEEIVEQSTSYDCQIGRDYSVFGDDIIVPSQCYEDVYSALRFFGFTPSETKSFGTGPFKESCGGDYWEGKDVRPHFLKKLPNEPQEWISLANGLNRLASRNAARHSHHNFTHRAWNGCLAALPSDVRQCRGPEALGDVVIHDDEERWRSKWRDNIRYLRAYLPATYREVGFTKLLDKKGREVRNRPRRRTDVEVARWDSDVVLAYALYNAGWSGSGASPYSPPGTPSGDLRPLRGRDSVTGYTRGWIAYS